MDHKYTHIKTLRDVDEAIIRAELRKKIIKDEMHNQVEDVKRNLRPVGLFWDAFRIFATGSGTKSPAHIVIGAVAELLTTYQASKYATKLLKKMFS